MNNRIESLAKIKNANIVVNITGDQGVTTSKQFKNIELSYSEDYPIKFMVPAKTSRISLSFTASVQKQLGNDQRLSSSEDITIDRFEGESLRIFSVYLTH